VTRHARAIAGAALLLCSGGCAFARTHVRHRADEFAQTETWLIDGNALSAPPGAQDWAALDVEAVRPRGDTIRYTFVVDYRAGSQPLRLRRGESLIVLADTSRYVFSTAQVHSQGNGLRGSRETARYPVSREAMRRIATAGQIRVRMVGQRWYVDRTVTNRGLWRFRRLMEAVEGIPLPEHAANIDFQIHMGG
jgi:hypothetical protein